VRQSSGWGGSIVLVPYQRGFRAVTAGTGTPVMTIYGSPIRGTAAVTVSP
jgi:hypothetical protein